MGDYVSELWDGVARLDVSDETQQWLAEAGVRTIGDLVRMGAPDVLKRPGGTMELLNELQYALADLGFALGMNLPVGVGDPDRRDLTVSDTSQPAHADVEKADAVDPEAAQAPAICWKPITELGLSATTIEALHGGGIFTLAQVARRTEREILSLSGAGPATLNDIKKQLFQIDWSLGMSFPEHVGDPQHSPYGEE